MIERVKILKMKGCGASFTELSLRSGDLKEGVWCIRDTKSIIFIEKVSCDGICVDERV